MTGSTDFVNYYRILGVREDASESDILRAYKRLSMKWHPDRNKSTQAGERMSMLNRARETLMNPSLRRIFNQTLAREKLKEAAEARARAADETQAKARAKAEAYARAKAEEEARAKARAEHEARRRFEERTRHQDNRKPFVNYYEVVNLREDASQQELDQAWRELVTAYARNPQLFNKNSVNMILNAYAVLRDEEARKRFDKELFRERNRVRVSSDRQTRFRQRETAAGPGSGRSSARSFTSSKRPENAGTESAPRKASENQNHPTQSGDTNADVDFIGKFLAVIFILVLLGALGLTPWS